MNTQFLQEHVNTVLSDGLASTVLQKPADPVAFLGKWLLSYVQSEVLKAKVQTEQAVRSQRVAEFLEAERVAAEEKERRLAEKLREQREYEDFLSELSQSHVSQSADTVLNLAIGGLQKFVNASSVYVAELVDPDHLKYINATSENNFIVDEVLERGNGITFDLFPSGDDAEEQAEEEEDDPDDDSEEAVERRKKHAAEKEQKAQEIKTVEVKDVLIGAGSGKVHFFRQPQLGAFLAARIHYPSAMHEEAVQKAAERDAPSSVPVENEEEEESKKSKKGKKGKKAAASDDEEEEEEEEPAEEEDEDAKERKAQADKKAEEEEAKKREWASFSEEEKTARKQKEEMDRLLFEIPFQTKEFALGLDTLKQNRPFNAEQIERVKAIARLIQSELVSVDRLLFQQEVRRRIKLNSAKNHSIKKKEESKFRKDLASKLGQDASSPDVNFGFRKACVATLKESILEWNQHIIFRGAQNVVEAFLYLLGFTQQQLVDKSNQVTWKTLRQKFNESVWELMTSYDARAEEIPEDGDNAIKYQLINQRIEESTFDDIKEQNYPLAELLGFITDALAVKAVAKDERLAREEAERAKREEEEERRREEEERSKEAGDEEENEED